jgi:S-adenosylmethionine hydrolase
MTLITLLTDFGDSPYPGTMKGIMHALAPGVKVVDLHHHVPMGDVKVATHILYHSYLHFPAYSVHVAVVDTGVGSERRVILAQAEEHLFVAPDNGILTLILERTKGARVFELQRWEFVLPRISATFHGRDIFAPLGAWLARGVPMPMLGRAIDDPFQLDLPHPKQHKGKFITQILWVDSFGNLITNMEHNMLRDKPAKIMLASGDTLPLVSHYSQPDRGRPGAIWNSWDLLEIFVREGSAREALGLTPGDSLDVIFDD